MIYYKIVYRVESTPEDILLSATYRSLPEVLHVIYQVNQWTESNYGPLFIFYHLSNAIYFARGFVDQKNLEIWEVEVEGLRPQAVVLSAIWLKTWDTWGVLKGRLTRFFGRGAPLRSFTYTTPSGTAVADRVRLVRRVKK